MADTFLQSLLNIGANALSGVSVSIKTNYGPEIPVPISDDDSRGLLSDLVGLRAGLIIRNREGTIIETIGDPAPTSPVRLTLLIAAVSVTGFIFLRGIVRQ